MNSTQRLICIPDRVDQRFLPIDLTKSLLAHHQVHQDVNICNLSFITSFSNVPSFQQLPKQNKRQHLNTRSTSIRRTKNLVPIAVLRRLLERQAASLEAKVSLSVCQQFADFNCAFLNRSEHRTKLVKSAVASSLVLMPGKDKMKTHKKKLQARDNVPVIRRAPVHTSSLYCSTSSPISSLSDISS